MLAPEMGRGHRVEVGFGSARALLLMLTFALMIALPGAASAQFQAPDSPGDLQTGPFVTSTDCPQPSGVCGTITTLPGVDTPVAASGTGSFGDGEMTSMTWAWGDGSSTTDTGVATSGGTTYQDNSSHAYASPGTYMLTVTVNDQTDGSSLSNTFTVIVGTPPQLTLSDTQDHPIVGDSVTYTENATGTSSNCACTYSLTATNPSNVSSQQGPQSSNQFSVSYTSAGSWNLFGQVVDPVNGNGDVTEPVTVSPALTGGVTGPTGAVVGQNVTFNANASGGYTTAAGYAYSWSFNGVHQSSTTSSASGMFAVGSNTISVTISDDASPAHSITRMTTLNVPNPPQLTLSSSQDHPIVGESVTYTANATGTSPSCACTYAFSNSDPLSNPASQGSSPSNTFATTFGTTGAWQVMGSLNDPVNGSAQATDDVTVSPTLAGGVTGPTGATVGQNVAFNATASGGYTTGAGYSYSWKFDNVTQSATGTSASGTFTAGQHTISVTIGDDASPAHAIIKSTTIQVDPVLSPSFTVTANPVTGSSVSFNASATTGGRAPLTYAWDFGSGSFTGSGQTTTHTFTTPGSYTVRLQVTDALGRTATTSQTVQVDAPLAPSFSVTPASGALTGSSVSFNATGTTGGRGPLTYAWDFGSGSFTGSGQTTTHTFTTPGSYTVRLQVTDAVGRTATTSQTVQVDAPLSPSFTVSSSPQAATPVSFSAAGTTGGRAPLTYAWDFGTGTFTGSGQTTTNTFATAGSYTVRLQVTDALGRTATTSQTVTVAVQCLKTVTVGLAQETTSGCITPNSDGTFTTTNAVSLNGIPFPAPAAGHPIVLTSPTTAHPGGQFSDNSVSLVLDGFTVYTGSVSWNLPAATGSNPGTVATLSVPSGAKVKGLPVIGTVSLAFGKDSSGTYYSAFPLHVQLPAAFKTGPSGAAPTVTGDASLRVDSAGVHYDGLKVQVANAWVGDLQVKNVCFSYVPGGASGAVSPCSIPTLGGQPFIQCGSNPNANRWDGNAVITLPTPSKATVALFGGVSNGSLANLGGFADNLGTSVPIAEGVFLTRVGFGLCLTPPPLQLKGVVGVSALPQGGSSAVTVNGSFDFTDTNPWSLNLSGEVTSEGIDLGGGSLTMYPTGLALFDVHSNFSLARIVTVSGDVNGWLWPAIRQFSLAGSAHACISSLCASASAVLSTVGVAGCLNLGSFTYYTLARNSNWHWYAPWRVHWVSHTVHIEAGFGYRWHASSPSLFGGSCDLSDYSATLAADIAAGRGFTVPAGTGAIAVRIGGKGSVPVVSLKAPNGTVINPPASGTSQRLANAGAYIENPDDNSTSVLLIKPAAGRWTITPATSSSPITTIQTAVSQPPAVALGAVQPVGGGRYGLHYAYALPAGETMQLFVRGPHNGEQSLGRASGRPCTHNQSAPGRSGRLCQNVTFTPLAGPAGVRTVVGLLSRHGMPGSTVTIATFKLSKPVVPKGPKVKLAIKRGGLAITWSRVRGATSYAISVALGDGSTLSLTATKRSAFVAGAASNLPAKVQVWALGSTGITGRPGSAKRA